MLLQSTATDVATALRLTSPAAQVSTPENQKCLRAFAAAKSYLSAVHFDFQEDSFTSYLQVDSGSWPL